MPRILTNYKRERRSSETQKETLFWMMRSRRAKLLRRNIGNSILEIESTGVESSTIHVGLTDDLTLQQINKIYLS